ncbi:hypothetical protein [Aminobacter sp. Piv2-1]|uniref:hypothetical protein n=1 Tax=Aminobacter sp. Piv2-1 TaxID=3031122 RepID=UPI00309F39ED
MRLIKSRDVPAMTGLTADQLREWTVRRDFVRPDVPAQKRGSQAQFSWKSLLVLRLASVLRVRFHVELEAHRELLQALRGSLDGLSFHALWGGSLVVYGDARAELVTPRVAAAREGEDAIVLQLDPHLAVLSQGLGLPEPVAQLTLFPVVGLKTASVLDQPDLRRTEIGRTKTEILRMEERR